MSATETVVDQTVTNTPSEVLAVLSQILALTPAQRQSLGAAWAAMDPEIAFGPVQLGSSDADATGQPVSVDPAEVEKLNAWMQEKAVLPPRDRINQLQAAIDQEGEDWPIPLLNAEIIKIKNANPWLAAELAVIKYAYDHPVLMLVALSGLGLALYKFGKAAFVLIF